MGGNKTKHTTLSPYSVYKTKGGNTMEEEKHHVDQQRAVLGQSFTPTITESVQLKSWAWFSVVPRAVGSAHLSSLDTVVALRS